MNNYKNIAMKLICLALLPLALFGANVETLETYSEVMNKTIMVNVVVPDNYSKNKQYSVVYLLHGYGGDHNNWLYIAQSEIKQFVDRMEFIVVLPNGSTSWYFDSPVDRSLMYETYITKELIEIIDSRYSTYKSSSQRAISGFSMGGHGALFLAIRHIDIFGAAGSMAGAVYLTPFSGNWELDKRLGSVVKNRDLWEKNSAINMLDRIRPNSLKIIIDCGADDFFYHVNQKFHKQALEKGIAHIFIVREGGHTAEYAAQALIDQLLFFSEGFDKNAKPIYPRGD
jgi:S-formylglutathione hydrolase FrmB